MTGLQIFQNEQFGTIRGLIIDNEPWFIGVDVAKALGYARPNDAIRAHVDTEDKGTTVIHRSVTANTTVNHRSIPEDKNTAVIHSPIPGNPNKLVINESGLYSLILSSKLPQAKAFKRWVTSEVLPAIRKTGQYVLSETPTRPVDGEYEKQPLTPDDYLRAASIIAGCKKGYLPMVIDLLEKGGFEVQTTQKIRQYNYEQAMIDPMKMVETRGNTVPDCLRDHSGECKRLLEKAHFEYGMEYSHLANAVGLHRTQITRIVNGQIPSIKRSTILQQKIREMYPDIDK